MFKSIEYVRYDYKTKSNIYKLIDTEFECEVGVTGSYLVVIISEYKKRNYPHQDIVKNLFRYILYLCNKFDISFEEELHYHNTYIDMFFNDLNFSKLYYQDIKDMWDKHKVFV